VFCYRSTAPNTEGTASEGIWRLQYLISLQMLTPFGTLLSNVVTQFTMSSRQAALFSCGERTVGRLKSANFFSHHALKYCPSR